MLNNILYRIQPVFRVVVSIGSSIFAVVVVVPSVVDVTSSGIGADGVASRTARSTASSIASTRGGGAGRCLWPGRIRWIRWRRVVDGGGSGEDDSEEFDHYFMFELITLLPITAWRIAASISSTCFKLLDCRWIPSETHLSLWRRFNTLPGVVPATVRDISSSVVVVIGSFVVETIGLVTLKIQYLISLVFFFPNMVRLLENLSNLSGFVTRWVGWCRVNGNFELDWGLLNCPRVIWGFLRRLSWSCWTRIGRRRDPPTEWIVATWVEEGRETGWVVVGIGGKVDGEEEEVDGMGVVVVRVWGVVGGGSGGRTDKRFDGRRIEEEGVRCTEPKGIGDNGALIENGDLVDACLTKNCWFWIGALWKFWTLWTLWKICCRCGCGWNRNCCWRCVMKGCLGWNCCCCRLELLDLIVVVRWLALTTRVTFGLVRDEREDTTVRERVLLWDKVGITRRDVRWACWGWWVVFRRDDLWRGRWRWLIWRVKRLRWSSGEADGSLK